MTRQTYTVRNFCIKLPLYLMEVVFSNMYIKFKIMFKINVVLA